MRLSPKTRIQQFARIPECISLPEYPYKHCARLPDCGPMPEYRISKRMLFEYKAHQMSNVTPPGSTLKMDPESYRLLLHASHPITQIPSSIPLDRRILSPEYKKLTSTGYTRSLTRLTSTNQQVVLETCSCSVSERGPHHLPNNPR